MRTTSEHTSLADVTEFRLGAWTVSPGMNQLRRNGNLVALQNLSMQVLVYLADRQGEVVTYDELLEALWRGRVIGGDAIHRRIADLRRNLGDNSGAPKYIQTIHKKGYRLIAPVRLPAASPVRRWRHGLVAGVALGIIVLTALFRTESDAPETNYVAAIEAADEAISRNDLPATYRAIKPLLVAGLDDPNLDRISAAVTTPVIIKSNFTLVFLNAPFGTRFSPITS